MSKKNKQFVQVNAGQIIKADEDTISVAVDMLQVEDMPKGYTNDKSLLAKLWSNAT